MSVDSGVIAIDKARGWTILDIAMLFNEHWREAYTISAWRQGHVSARRDADGREPAGDRAQAFRG